MSDEIRITAHITPSRPNACRFTVDRPVYEERSAYFWSKETAKASPLALKLFELEGVIGARLAGHDVVLTRDSANDWKPFSGKVAEVIRAQLRSGEPAVSESFKPDLKSQIEIKNKVQLLFDTQINPAVAGHGGNIELVDVKDNRIYIKMGGGCHGCGMANVTLREGIETTVREQLPEIDEILDVTDHASGATPYYEASPAAKK